MNEFIQQLDVKYDISYDAGYVGKNGCDFIIDHATKGAEQTFSVGQPVYDKDWNIMGWLGIGLFSHLDYNIKGVRVPVSYWKICLPTEFCEVGKEIYTYWQMIERENKA